MLSLITTSIFALGLAGCATTNNPHDPLENYNRMMFSVNDNIDQYALKPVATAYHNTLPSFVQTGIGNFFGNLGDVWIGVNNVLQGKVNNGLSDFMRFGVNSTFGFGGLFDIGTAIGIAKHNEDFGQTLGWWGVASGPYVVLPFFGPSTLRDSIALPVDFTGDLWIYKYPVRQRNEGIALRVVDQRASALDASKMIENAALDRYEFVRDAYLQRRESQIHDDAQQRPKPDDSAKPKLPDGASKGATVTSPLAMADKSDATEPHESPDEMSDLKIIEKKQNLSKASDVPM